MLEDLASIVLAATTMEEQYDDDEDWRDTSIGLPPGAAPSATASGEADDVPDSTIPGSRTQKGDAIGVADKMLAQGQAEDAGRLLSLRMSNLLEEAEAGRPISEPVVVSATEYALKPARASRRPSWIALLFRIYARPGRPMPLDAIDQPHDLVRITPEVRVEPLDQYLEALGGRRDGLSPTERFALRRLEGLRKLIASR